MHFNSNIYVEGPRTKLSILFFSYVLREQKGKNKVCVLTLYQDLLIFSLLKDTKMTKLKLVRQILTLRGVV